MRVPPCSIIPLLLCVAWPISADQPPKDRQEFIHVRGSKLYIEIFGHGSPVLFLHGGLHSFDNSFARQRDEFARTHTVVGFDQRGHGHSPDDDRPFAYREMAEDTADVIRLLKLGPVDVVGHSDGGDVALLLARRHPDLVRRVVISGANLRAGLSSEELTARQQWSDEQMREFLVKYEQRLPPQFRIDYQAVTPDGADHWNVHLAKSYRLWLTPMVIEPAELASIQAPVLVIAGDKDFTPLEETAEIFNGLPHAQLFIVPGTGHGTFDQSPELLNPAILRFLDAP